MLIIFAPRLLEKHGRDYLFKYSDGLQHPSLIYVALTGFALILVRTELLDLPNKYKHHFIR